MQTRFLLGPSGSGKTFRCVAEARKALISDPAGPPLLFLCPKQATFQLERQFLADPALPGYTRLRILSFERLADTILTQARQEPAQLLTEEGRVMVLRALLSRRREELKLFRATARLRGFAQQLSQLLREFQHAQITPEQLRALAGKIGNQLGLKLEDLATMQAAYLEWVQERHLHDRDELLSLAAQALVNAAASLGAHGVSPESAAAASRHSSVPEFEALWVDGFAELTVQETDFLLALLPLCRRATLAFNFVPEASGASWLSTWSLVGQTVRELLRRLGERTDTEVSVENLDHNTGSGRFVGNPALAELERSWPAPGPASGRALGVELVRQSLRLAACANPEAEATLAAREIRRFVRAGGRYREAAIIVRDLNDYFHALRRVLMAYEIPFFMDRREPVGHHPLLELTRSALRTVAYDWEHEDWFGALKTGLVHEREADVDRLENEALARGWTGPGWLQPLRVPDNPPFESWLEGLRQKLLRPFEQLKLSLGISPSGEQLAEAIGDFWQQLSLADKLTNWSTSPEAHQNPALKAVHLTLWEQMQDWLQDVALAFAHDRLPLREWLPILEAGLANQTVGIIPPTLDQVLVGAIDRSRNPELKLALVLGVNEGVFPAVPTEASLLSWAEVDQLEQIGVPLGTTARRQLSREQYLGYVAFSRARERLVVTWARRDRDERELNRSPFIDHIQRIFPRLEAEGYEGTWALSETEHASELLITAAEYLGTGSSRPVLPDWLSGVPGAARLQEESARFRLATVEPRLTPAVAERLYGPTLETSVSRLEEYAACPFRFAITCGLRAEERKQFRLDVRHQGSFLHEILARFHQQLRSEDKKWHDLTPVEARERVAQLADTLIPEYGGGLLQATHQARFAARCFVKSLQDFVAVLVEWMPQYGFEPHAVELGFGLKEQPLPAWIIDLGEGHQLSFRGKIDRVDLSPLCDGTALCVVIDYKSSARKLDPVLVAHGVQLQLLAYLNVLRGLAQPKSIFGVNQLVPAGVFFVNLRGRYPWARTRRAALETAKEARALAYQHTGRFDLSALPKLDLRPGAEAGDQFNYRFREDGQLRSNCREPLPAHEFLALLDAVEGHLCRMGREIYAGRVEPDPYRKGRVTACEECEYQSICRIDPWTHPFRILREVGGEPAEGSEQKRT